MKKIGVAEHKKKSQESKPKKVVMEILERISTGGSLMHLSPYERMMIEINNVIKTRTQVKVYETIDTEIVDLTPKILSVAYEEEGFSKLQNVFSGIQMTDSTNLPSLRSATSSLMRRRSSRGIGFHMSVEDIMSGIGTDPIVLDDHSSKPGVKSIIASDSSLFSDSPSSGVLRMQKKHSPQFVRIILSKTELIRLYEQQSITALKNTEEGNLVEMNNKEYDFLTIGKGKLRRCMEAESQTMPILVKSRSVNTTKITTREVASFVSNYEIFNTYKLLHDIKNGGHEAEEKGLHTSQSASLENEYCTIAKLPSFQFASAIIGRLLAGNTFAEGQMRFRNMNKVSKTAEKISYKYSLKMLFIFQPVYTDGERKAVADMSFCPANGDILAVAYGIYSYQAAKLSKTGQVCIWNIKNPCNPERFYTYSEPVVSVEFSPFIPTLLAIGLFDGSVEIRDITYFNQPPVASSKRSSTTMDDPILAIKWFKQSISADENEIDPFLALSQDGSVTHFRLTKSPFLSSSKLMSIKRFEGKPEGLPISLPSSRVTQLSNCSSQGLGLIKHPVKSDIYYILNDDGCIHKYSINYQHHYLQVLKAHEGSVNHMDFSPWSPKLFLTCGNDWCLRIWIDGILEPLVTLRNLCQPYNWAAWSPTNSTILIAINRNQCEIWDLSRNILKPVSSSLSSSSSSTMGIFSLDGNSILIGNERGQVSVNALNDMPFPAHYQYETLEKSIYKAVSSYPHLLLALKSIGYFGYPKKSFSNHLKI